MGHKMSIKLVYQYLIMKRKANYGMNHQYHPVIYIFNQVLFQGGGEMLCIIKSFKNELVNLHEY